MSGLPLIITDSGGLPEYVGENAYAVLKKKNALINCEDRKDFALIKQFIQKVKAKGVKIAIDDFGTGYSNFERLLSYEPDILKIDGSLIKNIHNNQINQHIVETVMLFAKKQNLSTVAEFVENETIYEIVRDMGIDYSQGFYFGKPEMF